MNSKKYCPCDEYKKYIGEVDKGSLARFCHFCGKSLEEKQEDPWENAYAAYHCGTIHIKGFKDACNRHGIYFIDPEKIAERARSLYKKANDLSDMSSTVDGAVRKALREAMEEG